MRRAGDAELVSRLRATIAELRSALAGLPQTLSPRDEAALERWLQVAIQICIDLGDRILGARGVEEPARQADVFIALRGLGVLTREQASDMNRMVDLRNALVHDYPRFTAENLPDEVRGALPVLESVAASLIASLAP